MTSVVPFFLSVCSKIIFTCKEIILRQFEINVMCERLNYD